MNPLDDVQDAIAGLDQLTPLALRDALVSAYCELAFARGQRDTGTALLNSTRDYTDTLKRRADLIHAISDHITANALDATQLDAIAAIVWPAPSPVAHPNICVAHNRDDCGVECWGRDISEPTKLPAPELLQASALLWNAHWFFKCIEDVGKGPSRLTLGDFLARNIDAWRSNVNAWRTNTGVEKHETEEVKAMPH